MTFWKCGEALRPGQFVEVDFPELEPADSVEIQTAPNQWGIRLKLEGQDASGQWKPLAAEPQASDAPVPPGLRRAATDELRAVTKIRFKPAQRGAINAVRHL